MNKINDIKVTIVTPSYNQGEYIERTILSVINQTYKNIEYIIFDSCSTDNTINILSRYKDRVKIFVEKDKGQTDAINKGFKMASGHIVGWINSDDELLPDCVEKVVNAFNKGENIGIVYGDTILIDKDDNEIGDAKNPNITFNKLININSSVVQPGSFYKKDLVEKVGYLDDNLNYVMDFDLWIKLLKISNAYYIPEYLSKFRFHDLSKTRSAYLKFLPEKTKIIIKNKGKLFSPNMYNIARCYAGALKFKIKRNNNDK